LWEACVSEGTVFDLGRLGVDSAAVTLGEEIRRARELKGLTARELATILGVAENTIGNWENDRTLPRGKMARIRQVLDMEDPDAEDDSPSLAEASNLELIVEMSRRLGVSLDAAAEHGRTFPDVPPGRYRWPKPAAPSSRTKSKDSEKGRKRRHQA
jgi:transcriptional regulator with XRE-family HTH domain